MNGKRVEEIMQSHGVINISYNGMPVWVEGIKGEIADVTVIDMNKRMSVPISALAEADSMQTM